MVLFVTMLATTITIIYITLLYSYSLYIYVKHYEAIRSDSIFKKLKFLFQNLGQSKQTFTFAN